MAMFVANYQCSHWMQYCFADYMKWSELDIMVRWSLFQICKVLVNLIGGGGDIQIE